MKSIFIFICMSMLCLNHFVKAQNTNNLVPNPSFEEKFNCQLVGDFSQCKYWYKYATVDYMDTCMFWGGNPNTHFIPRAANGWQYSKDGHAYIGIVAYYNNLEYFQANYREFASIKLKQTLEQQKSYCGSYYLSLANYSALAIHSMGMYFTQDSILAPPVPNLPDEPMYVWNFHPQIINKNGILNDTLNWMKIEGSFVSAGNETYMHLGNFTKLGEFMVQEMQPPSVADSFAYYYIDLVSLVELTKIPQITTKAYNCATGIITFTTDTGFNFRWYQWPDTVNVLSTADTFVVNANSPQTIFLRATLCSTEFTDTLFVPKLDCTSIEANALAQGAVLFPNPASNTATFSLQGVPPPGTFLQITDLNGKVLHKQNVSGKNTEVDVGALSNGMYLVTYHSSKGVIWKEKLAVIH